MIAFGLSGYPHPEIAVELREVRQELEQKYQQQLWKKEFLSNGTTFEKQGFFTAISLKTRSFEFELLGVDKNLIFLKSLMLMDFAKYFYILLCFFIKLLLLGRCLSFEMMGDMEV